MSKVKKGDFRFFVVEPDGGVHKHEMNYLDSDILPLFQNIVGKKWSILGDLKMLGISVVAGSLSGVSSKKNKVATELVNSLLKEAGFKNVKLKNDLCGNVIICGVEKDGGKVNTMSYLSDKSLKVLTEINKDFENPSTSTTAFSGTQMPIKSVKPIDP